MGILNITVLQIKLEKLISTQEELIESQNHLVVNLKEVIKMQKDVIKTQMAKIVNLVKIVALQDILLTA